MVTMQLFVQLEVLLRLHRHGLSFTFKNYEVDGGISATCMSYSLSLSLALLEANITTIHSAQSVSRSLSCRVVVRLIAYIDLSGSKLEGKLLCVLQTYLT